MLLLNVDEMPDIPAATHEAQHNLRHLPESLQQSATVNTVSNSRYVWHVADYHELPHAQHSDTCTIVSIGNMGFQRFMFDRIFLAYMI